MKTGVIDVGGGMRGIYAAGVFDRCMDEDIRFDLCIGISAGSANVSSYLAGQRGRNRFFYETYPFRKEYMSLGNFLRIGSYLDLDYIYGTLSNTGGECPLDYDAFAANPAELIVIACDADTGESRYFEKKDVARDDYRPMMASSAIPAVCLPYPIDGRRYFDGALGDTIPLQKAFDEGCDRVVLVLTKPKDTLRKADKDVFLARFVKRRWPVAAERLRTRAKRYNEGVALAKKLEAEGKVLIIAPEDTEGMDTLKKDRDAMERLYARGYEDAAAIRAFAAGD